VLFYFTNNYENLNKKSKNPGYTPVSTPRLGFSVYPTPTPVPTPEEYPRGR